MFRAAQKRSIVYRAGERERQLVYAAGVGGSPGGVGKVPHLMQSSLVEGTCIHVHTVAVLSSTLGQSLKVLQGVRWRQRKEEEFGQ